MRGAGRVAVSCVTETINFLTDVTIKEGRKEGRKERSDTVMNVQHESNEAANI